MEDHCEEELYTPHVTPLVAQESFKASNQALLVEVLLDQYWEPSISNQTRPENTTCS